MKRITRLSETFFCLFVIVPALWTGTALGAKEINVPRDNPDIQAAINAAADGDTVRVDDGIYSRPLSIVGRAINIESKNGPDNCAIVIGENQTGTVITFAGIETAGSVLSGFTISGGNGVDYGGGILCDNGASPTIENCVITGNQAKFGGGIASLNSSPIIQDCDIEANTSLSGGGGLYIYTDLNLPPTTPPIITEGAIFDNVGGNFGGGLYIYNSSPFISSCLIAGNSASLRGAGIYCFTTSSPIITNCTVADNTLTGSNSLGGGIHVFNKCHPEIKNSILWNDSATYGPEIYLNANSSLHVSSSDVMGGDGAAYVYDKPNSTLTWDDTNINEDPLFVGQDDYHLSPESPCIDAGIDTGDLPEFDFEGEDPRIINGKPDMGADEFRTEVIVDIDIMPRSRHKEIDLRDKGVVPVAVLSSKDKDFDARMIDPNSVLFAGAAPVRSVLNNVNRNYHLDMVFFFKTQQLDLDENSSEATLTGKTVDGVSFKGTDSVTIYKPKCKAKTLWKSAKIKHRFRHKHVHRHCSK